MSESLFGNARADPLKIKFDLHPKPVKPDGTSFSKHTPAPDKEYKVYDENNEFVGTIFVPTDFCPGLSCPYSVGEKHVFSFYNSYSANGKRRWVHTYCDRPTLVWWTTHLTDLLTTPSDLQEWSRVNQKESS